jgi:hypothetical protein
LNKDLLLKNNNDPTLFSMEVENAREIRNNEIIEAQKAKQYRSKSGNPIDRFNMTLMKKGGLWGSDTLHIN